MPPVRFDLLLAATLLVFQIGGSIGAARRQADRATLDAVAFLLLAIGPVALAVRRRWPVPVLVVTLGATLAYLSGGYPYGPIFFSLLVAFFTAVIAGHRLAAWLVAGTGLAVYITVVPLAGQEPRPGWLHVFGIATWLLLVLVVAEVLRMGRERRVEKLRAYEQERRRQASEQRLRIAQDLHDALAHNISMINVQAGVALHLIDERPEQAQTALAAIKEASSDALGELRSVLEVLRQPETESTITAHRLDDLEELLSRASIAGLTVSLRTQGRVRRLQPNVESAAYRVIQEALTNVVRHAAASTVTVVVRYGDDALTLLIDDNGTGAVAATPGTGSGIAGMTERITALGGSLEAGPRSGGGFRVRAGIPLGGEP
jgi:signal transduction histidine kinase